MNDANDDLANDSDRHWLVYELHDGLLQWIITARMNIEDTVSRIATQPEVAETVGRQLKQTQRFLEEAIDEGRMLIEFLEHSPDHASISIADQLLRFVELKQFDAEMHGQELIVHPPKAGQWPSLTPEKAWNMLRIIEQAINNAIGHAGPCQILINNRLDSNSYQVVVRDDGSGFDLDRARAMQDHFGIPAMEHRAKLIGARLEIRTAPGEGTCITISAPIDA